MIHSLTLPTGDDFVNAKARGMRSRLYEDERLLALTDSRNLTDLFKRLFPGQTFIGHVAFERELTEDMLRSLATLHRYLGGKVRALFEWLLAQRQLDNLKIALRCHLAKGDATEAEAMMVPLPRWLELPSAALLSAPDLRRFAAALPRGPFARVLQAAAESREAPDAFRMEMQLDQMYTAELLRRGGAMGGRTRAMTAHDVDARRLMLVLRSRFNYNRTPAEVAPYLTHGGMRAETQWLDTVFAAPDVASVVRLLPKLRLPAAQGQAIQNLRQLEDALERRLYALASLAFAQSVLEEESAIAFYYIKWTEHKNLIRLTEGVRHSLPREEIARHLILRTRQE